MAAAPAITYDALAAQIDKRQLAPIYLLHGEEGYYIDALVKKFGEIIPEEDKEFDEAVMYAPERSVPEIIEACRRYPLMNERQIVIVKEAQAIRADQLNKLSVYASSPSPTTTLVVCCRGAVCKAKNLIDETKKHGGVIFESKKIDDRQIGTVISGFIRSKGLNVEPKALAMLRDYVGSDLSRLYNEIDKLTIILGPGAMVTPESIERNIGFSKDFNNFELIKALANHDSLRAFQIIDYFRSNPKNNPTVLTVGILFNYFSNLLLLHFCRDKSERAMAAELGFKSTYALMDYRPGLRHYNAYRTIEIISAIRDFDRKAKGVGSRQNEYDLLHDLIFHILTAPGDVSF